MIKLSWIFFTLMLFSYSSVADTFKKEDYYVLAEAIYFESAGESEVGQRAVGHVILTRYLSNDWPDSISEVVYQPHRSGTNTTKCQFSYTCDHLPIVIREQDYEQFHQIAILAYELLDGKYHFDITGGADHYVRCDLTSNPGWWDRMEFTGRFEDHCFYVDNRRI